MPFFGYKVAFGKWRAWGRAARMEPKFICSNRDKLDSHGLVPLIVRGFGDLKALIGWIGLAFVSNRSFWQQSPDL